MAIWKEISMVNLLIIVKEEQVWLMIFCCDWPILHFTVGSLPESGHQSLIFHIQTSGFFNWTLGWWYHYLLSFWNYGSSKPCPYYRKIRWRFSIWGSFRGEISLWIRFLYVRIQGSTTAWFCLSAFIVLVETPGPEKSLDVERGEG